MEQESNDISLNISYSTPEGGDSKKAKRRGNKRKAVRNSSVEQPKFVTRKNTGLSINVTSKGSYKKSTQNYHATSSSSVGKSNLKSVDKTVSFESDGDDDAESSPQSAKRFKSQTGPKQSPSSKPHIRGLGLPRKSKAVETVTFENEEGPELERDHHNSTKSAKSFGVTSSLFNNNPEIPSFASRAVKPVTESVFSTELFKDLPIHPFMVSNLEQNLKLTKLTTVQQKAIPTILSGVDALVRSQTGSGKTLAYALPIVEALQKIRPKLPRSAGIKAVVVVPTRELALQTYELFVKLVKPFTWLVPGYLVGGEKRKSEKARLRKGITILIGTPGRILDHVVNTKVMIIDSVKWLVLDEADRLLDLGYEKDVSSLVSSIDAQAEANPDIFTLDSAQNPSVIRRQTVLVSATLTSAVQRLAGLALHTPTHVDAADGVEDENSDLSIPESLDQFYVVTPTKLRLVSLAGLVHDKCTVSGACKMLVFFATQDMVDFYTELLSTVLGHDSAMEFFKLHGSMSQKDRTECFRTFRQAASGVLLCTDVAARGLDLPRVDWIVQYTAPCTLQDYVHRVGRTARVGQAGHAVTFLNTTEMEFVRRLEDRRIRLREMNMDLCLQALRDMVPAEAKKAPPTTVEAAATALQLSFETAVMEQKGLHGMACKAYISFVRFYAGYPKELRAIFSFKNLHLGHLAKSFALRDPPTSISGVAGRQWQDDAHTRTQKKQFTTSGPNKGKSLKSSGPGQSRAKMLVTSEYSSGLPERKKKKPS